MSRKILIVGPSWVGDMVMAQALFIALQEQADDALLIDVLAPGWSRPLLERMPQVRRAIELPFAHGELSLRARFRFGRALRKERYDQVILLPNSFKSALIPLFARILLRTGWRGEMRGLVLNDCRILDKERLPLMVQRFVALAHAPDAALPAQLPRPALRAEAALVAQAMRAFSLSTAQGRVLALCPGAEFGDAKQWPAEHYAAVAEKMIGEGWQVWLFGSTSDKAVCDQLVRALPESQAASCYNLAGRTTLAQAIDLLSVADAVVSNDSGLMHIAAALNRRVVAVYGSTSADFTPPLSDQAALLATDISCRPCFQRQCPLQHKRCLTELLPERVYDAIQSLLADPERGVGP